MVKTHLRDTPATRDQTLLPATRHRWIWPTITPARLNLPIPKGWKAEMTLVLVIFWDGLPVHKQPPIHIR